MLRQKSAFVRVKDLSLSYGGRQVISGLGFEVEQGDLVCIIGPSGCGKTSLLRSIGGFEVPLDGEIFLDETCLSKADTFVEPEMRNIGFVFQELALFPHLNVEGNVGFAIRDVPKAERVKKVNKFLQSVGLSDLGNRYCHELSGGQKQRVALVRALAQNPKLLLLDEPFSSLDEDLAKDMARELKCLLKEHGLTAIMVTHNQEEAFVLADKVMVMFEGGISQFDSPKKIYERPSCQNVAGFVGEGFFLETQIRGQCYETDIFTLPIESVVLGRGIDKNSENLKLFVRPEQISASKNLAPGDAALVVQRVEFAGATARYFAVSDKQENVCFLAEPEGFAVGDKVSVRPNLGASFILYDDGFN